MSQINSPPVLPGGSISQQRYPSGTLYRALHFDEAVHMVRKCGVGAELVRYDIKLAFQILPVHPLDFSLLGFHFQGFFYIDRVLPMGCSVSCAVFK